MNARQAILRAANSIEKYPDLFRFSSTDLPQPECGSPGCALGWIAFHASKSAMHQYREVLDISNSKIFYLRLHRLCGGFKWKRSATVCSSTLRLYANKYHPETNHIPASIRQIFKQPVLS